MTLTLFENYWDVYNLNKYLAVLKCDIDFSSAVVRQTQKRPKLQREHGLQERNEVLCVWGAWVCRWHDGIVATGAKHNTNGVYKSWSAS